MPVPTPLPVAKILDAYDLADVAIFGSKLASHDVISMAMLYSIAAGYFVFFITLFRAVSYPRG